MNKKLVLSCLFGLSGLMAAFVAVAAVKYQQSPVRVIASISAELPFAIKNEDLKLPKIKEELSLNCRSTQDESHALAQTSQVVILKFSECQNFSKNKAVSYNIKNSTNGYQGHIFTQKTKASSTLSTDYIQLEAGENIIEFEIRLNDGQKLNKKIKINRIASF